MKQEIKDELKALGSNLAEMQVGMPYVVPEGYFNDFVSGVNDVVTDDKKVVVGGLPTKQLPYDMPTGYFDNLPNRIAENITGNKRKGVLISFRQLRLAAAAMVIIAIGLGIYNLTTHTADNGKGGLLASVADKEISEYIAYTYQPVADKIMNNNYLDKVELDAKEIISYLDATGWGNDVY